MMIPEWLTFLGNPVDLHQLLTARALT